jgi:hypothetical protein
MVGDRLQISADVDLAASAELKQMLDHYEKILKLVSNGKH